MRQAHRPRSSQYRHARASPARPSCVRNGRVGIVVHSLHGDEMTLSILGPRDIAELSIIDEQPRSASAEAISTVEFVTPSGT